MDAAQHDAACVLKRETVAGETLIGWLKLHSTAGQPAKGYGRLRCRVVGGAEPCQAFERFRQLAVVLSAR